MIRKIKIKNIESIEIEFDEEENLLDELFDQPLKQIESLIEKIKENNEKM